MSKNKEVLHAMSSIDELFKEIESVPDYASHTVDSVYYKNGYGDTPLHIVSCWGDLEAIKLLVSSGADINAKGESGFTPLHCAAEQNHPGAIELLISLGAKQLKSDDNVLPIELAQSLNNNEAASAFH